MTTLIKVPEDIAIRLGGNEELGTYTIELKHPRYTVCRAYPHTPSEDEQSLFLEYFLDTMPPEEEPRDENTPSNS